MPPALLLVSLCALAGLLPGAAQADDQVTVYRCQTPAGNVTFSDAPCPAGQHQEMREMLRPRELPASSSGAAPTAPPPTAPIVHDMVVYRTPPRPMYECTTDEGRTYTSDNGDGSPRLVPIWSLGYPGGGVIHGRHAGGAVVVGNTWIRDACHQLSQGEACNRLRDRRYEIQRQYHSALQSDRQALDREQRGLDARLDNDCGAG